VAKLEGEKCGHCGGTGICTRGKAGAPCEECVRYWLALNGQPEQGDQDDPPDTCSCCGGSGEGETTIQTVQVVSGAVTHRLRVPSAGLPPVGRPPMGRAPTPRPPHIAAV